MTLCPHWRVRLFRIAALALAATQPAIADEPVTLNSPTGELAFRYTDLAGNAQTASFGPLFVDDEPLMQYALNASLTWRSGPARFAIEPVSDRAVATHWTLDAPRRLRLKIHGTHASFGGGERFTMLNLQGHILDMVSTDHPEAKGGASYKPVPFYMSSAGYGVWIDSFSPGRIEFNASDRFAVTLEYNTNDLRIVLIRGPTFAAILDEFTRLSGRPRVPPDWAFGVWKSRDVHRNAADVLEDIESLRKHDIPASVLVIDSPWETGYNDFELNREQFNDPDALFARVRRLGFYPCFWLTPFINNDNRQDMTGIVSGATSTFAEAAQRGYFVKDADGNPVITEWWKGRGALIDFTNPDATNWWQTQVAKIRQWGGHAIKCDDGEGNFIKSARFADGSSADEMRNRYSMLYLAATRAFLDESLDGDGVIIGRSGFTGMHQYAMGWAGDNASDWTFENGLPTAIIAAQTASLSGQPFCGSDIAGYFGKPPKELFIRWTQFSCFAPLMMVHMTSNLGPWDFDEQTLAIFRDYAKLHTRLFPYMRDAARFAAETGMSLIRPMPLAFQDESDAWPHTFQFMFGRDLLVAPLYQPGTQRSVYLPKGDWIDYWTLEPLTGPQTLQVEAPLERMPLYVRAGAIIPLLPEDVDTLIPRHDDMARDVVAIDDRRVLQVWPGDEAQQAEVGDDSQTPSTETRDGVSARLRRNGDQFTLEITCDPPRRLAIEIAQRSVSGISASGGMRFDLGSGETPERTVIAFKNEVKSTIVRWRGD
ncbi:MAG: glycoside hydrolase family 31 protein [Phycisphaerales bacterium]|nr:glycoside hydrolase family 31 protein [Phycisphaerales bacterium]